MLVQRLEQAVAFQRRARPAPERLEGAAAVCGRLCVECLEHGFERGELDAGDVAVVDQIAAAQRIEAGRLRLRELRLDVGGDIENVEEPPAGGRVGAAALGIGGVEGMQRVDAEEVAALHRHDLGKPGKVVEVADAPVALRPQAVELAGDAPAPAAAQKLRHEARVDRLRRGVERLCQALRHGRIAARADAEQLEEPALGVLGNTGVLAVGRDVGHGDAAGLGEGVDVGAHELARCNRPLHRPRRHRRLEMAFGRLSPKRAFRNQAGPLLLPGPEIGHDGKPRAIAQRPARRDQGARRFRRAVQRRQLGAISRARSASRFFTSASRPAWPGCSSFDQSSFEASKVDTALGSGMVARASGERKRSKRRNSLRRPSRTASASSSWKSQK
jgi:hypothetical protein